MSNFKRTLMADEGFREKVYLDHLGIPTIGYGTKIDELELTKDMAEYFLDREIAEKEARLEGIYEYGFLCEVRKDVIRSMAYQMGVQGTKNFRNMWRAIAVLDFGRAGKEMRDSRWWRDPKTRARAERMARRMEQGVWDV